MKLARTAARARRAHAPRGGRVGLGLGRLGAPRRAVLEQRVALAQQQHGHDEPARGQGRGGALEHLGLAAAAHQLPAGAREGLGVGVRVGVLIGVEQVAHAAVDVRGALPDRFEHPQAAGAVGHGGTTGGPRCRARASGS